MPDLDEFQRSFFDGLYTNRIPIAIGSIVLMLAGGFVAWRLGWFAAARRHPVRAGGLVVVVLAFILPIGYYTASPLWIRTELIEPDPVAAATTVAPTATPAATPLESAAPQVTPGSSPEPTPAPTPTAFAARKVAGGDFAGTDDFHFGKGTATIVETAPGAYTLRLDAFSVRNGPDLFVYLSPDAGDYANGALEVGKLKATDGAFGYALPAGTDPADFASALIWCKQFSHLFAIAPLAAL